MTKEKRYVPRPSGFISAWRGWSKGILTFFAGVATPILLAAVTPLVGKSISNWQDRGEVLVDYQFTTFDHFDFFDESKQVGEKIRKFMLPSYAPMREFIEITPYKGSYGSPARESPYPGVFFACSYNIPAYYPSYRKGTLSVPSIVEWIGRLNYSSEELQFAKSEVDRLRISFSTNVISQSARIGELEKASEKLDAQFFSRNCLGQMLSLQLPTETWNSLPQGAPMAKTGILPVFEADGSSAGNRSDERQGLEIAEIAVHYFADGQDISVLQNALTELSKRLEVMMWDTAQLKRGLEAEVENEERERPIVRATIINRGGRAATIDPVAKFVPIETKDTSVETGRVYFFRSDENNRLGKFAAQLPVRLEPNEVVVLEIVPIGKTRLACDTKFTIQLVARTAYRPMDELDSPPLASITC